MNNKIDNLKKLLEVFEPTILKIEDQSNLHANHYEYDQNSTYPSHVKIFIESKKFIGLTTLVKHRLIKKALEPAFKKGLHALSIET